MGITKINDLLSSNCKKSITVEPISNFKENKIAIDISTYMYKFLCKGEENLYKRLYFQVNTLLKHKITPIYVFDGKPPKEKSETIADRKTKNDNKKTEYANYLETCIVKYETSDIATLHEMDASLDILKKKITVKPTREHTEKCKQLLTLMGVPYIEANCESDIIISKLFKDKLIDAVISEDRDMLTFGCKVCISNFDYYGENVTVTKLDSVLEELGISYPQFVDMCILSGCDYCSKIKSIAVKKAYFKIKEDKNIENIIKKTVDKSTIPDDFHTRYISARDIFMNRPDLENVEFVSALKVNTTNTTELSQFLKDNSNYIVPVKVPKKKVIKKLI